MSLLNAGAGNSLVKKDIFFRADGHNNIDWEKVLREQNLRLNEKLRNEYCNEKKKLTKNSIILFHSCSTLKVRLNFESVVEKVFVDRWY